ncbi:MAG: hypothetical protein EOM28_11050 [Clostridia bacterium]|nr:hypothetical protein [Clostridia bacterium]
MVTPCLAYEQNQEIKQPSVEKYIRNTDLETWEEERKNMPNADVPLSKSMATRKRLHLVGTPISVN